MRIPVVAAVAALLCTASCGSCQPDRTPAPDASASASASEVATFPVIASHPPHSMPPPKPACRVVTIDGDVHIETGVATNAVDAGTTPLLLQGLAPTEAW